MFINIIYASFIAALITAFSSTFRNKILKWPLMAGVVALWLMTEDKADILRYLSDRFLGDVTATEVIKLYGLLLFVYVIVSLATGYILVKLSIKTGFTREKNIDILTALLILFVIVTNVFATIQNISKFYDSSYIYSTPAARSVLILWASLFIRRYMEKK